MLVFQYRQHSLRESFFVLVFTTRSLPLLLVHGFRGSPKAALDEAASKYTNIRLCMANVRLPYGIHHTVWVSPKLSPIDDNVQVNTDSETGFRADLIDYLRGYGSENAHDPSSPLGYWIKELSSHDFRPIRVFLVGSVSGRHTGPQLKKFGHPKLGELLSASAFNTPSSWPVVGQFSSIGSFGAQPTSWLTTEWSCSLAGRGARGLRMIYPCVDDVRNSLEGYDAGGCFPYTQRTAAKQPWLRQFLHRWQAGKHTRAAPHIKSYTRISPDGAYASWFLLTRLWLPNVPSSSFFRLYAYIQMSLGCAFKNGANCFTLITSSGRPEAAVNSSSSGSSDKIKPTIAAIPFPVPYDLPPVPYSSDDEPWLVDVPHEEPDVFGRIGEPV
ncbi:tyrosyl-DNA phosphodiesterase 1 [Paragonimus westermani]|uniref:Tyrosyl-DNA phosphodiesterase 1 n=1 Tax=Paragonimus westermani TaxID=34504 RepID=A0A5J4NMA4_9TREM|nr:tyrosyl-DNA phosphodiesterase 1 [Paragonimus westermani]